MKKNILMGLAVLAIAISCNKKEITTTEAERNDIENNRGRGDFDLGDPIFVIDLMGPHLAYKTDEFAELFKDFTEEKTQSFVINSEEATTVTGEQGVKIEFSANNFIDWRGRTVTGEVDIELIEVFSKGDMVMLDRATSAVSEDGTSVVTLSSAGEFYIRVSQDGRDVTLIEPITALITSTDADSDMQKFVEAGDVGDDFLWEKAAAPAIVISSSGRGGKDGGGGFSERVYEVRILPNQWGWMNLDKFYHSDCSKTSVLIEVPTGYDNTNTEVYLSFDDELRLANFDRWNGTHFTENWGQVCVGVNCNFIVVSNVGGSLEYAIQAATITDGHLEVIPSLSPISQADLIAEINGLP